MERTGRAAKSGRTVLVIDGRRAALQSLQAALEAAGHCALSADSPPAALALLAERRVDLVLVDQSMRAVSADQLLQRIRAVAPAVPVILHTGCDGCPGAQHPAHGHGQLLLWVESALRARPAVAWTGMPPDGTQGLLGRMSCNLRSPLQRIGGYADLLLDGSYGELPSAARAPLLSLVRTAHDLTHLLTNVLTHSRLAAGALAIERRRVGVDELTAQLCALAETLLDGRPVRFAVETADAPAALYTDPQTLTAILTNLIDNSARCTASGAITLTISRAADDAHLTVTDTGSGIAAGEMAQLFQPFAGDRCSGLGLGLALSRELAERLGGELSASSEPGVGSTFRLVLRGVIPNGNAMTYFRPWDDDAPARAE